MYLRRFLLSFLISFCACTAFDRYQWEIDPTAVRCDRVIWRQVERARIPGLCGNGAHKATETASCEMACMVISPYTEKEAHSIYLADGDSLWTHEVVKHGMKGLRHQ
jgi:hypothetical protein